MWNVTFLSLLQQLEAVASKGFYQGNANEKNDNNDNNNIDKNDNPNNDNNYNYNNDNNNDDDKKQKRNEEMWVKRVTVLLFFW